MSPPSPFSLESSSSSAITIWYDSVDAYAETEPLHSEEEDSHGTSWGVLTVRGCTDLEPVARSCDRAVNEMYSCLI